MHHGCMFVSCIIFGFSLAEENTPNYDLILPDSSVEPDSIVWQNADFESSTPGFAVSSIFSNVDDSTPDLYAACPSGLDKDQKSQCSTNEMTIPTFPTFDDLENIIVPSDSETSTDVAPIKDDRGCRPSRPFLLCCICNGNYDFVLCQDCVPCKYLIEQTNDSL